MRVEDAVRIRHMIGAAEAALSFVKDRTRPDLGQDQMLQFALVRAVEVVGEAAGKVSAEGRAEAPQVPWAVITGTRNRLVHAYFDIDLTSCGSRFARTCQLWCPSSNHFHCRIEKGQCPRRHLPHP